MILKNKLTCVDTREEFLVNPEIIDWELINVRLNILHFTIEKIDVKVKQLVNKIQTKAVSVNTILESLSSENQRWFQLVESGFENSDFLGKRSFEQVESDFTLQEKIDSGWNSLVKNIKTQISSNRTLTGSPNQNSNKENCPDRDLNRAQPLMVNSSVKKNNELFEKMFLGDESVNPTFFLTKISGL
jgi:hypothetical protein